MLVDVTLLRRAGLRLRKGELAAPARGHLALEDDPGTSNSFKRPLRVAHVYQAIGVQGTRQDVLKPLFDAVVIRIEAETITVAGLELASSEGRVVESGQVWRCALVRE